MFELSNCKLDRHRYANPQKSIGAYLHQGVKPCNRMKPAPLSPICFVMSFISLSVILIYSKFDLRWNK